MSLRDRTVIVTGGPTREWIDPVRYISNASSGKMGVALADEAASRARAAVFVHGPVEGALLTGKPWRAVAVESTQDMLEALRREIVPGAVLVMAAAPADYRPAERSAVKMKKSGDELVLRLTPTPDILKTLAREREEGTVPPFFAVGFAAETHNIEAYALGKLAEKRLDMICLNDVSAEGAGFGTDTNIITMFCRGGERIALPIMSKRAAAARIFDEVERRLPA